MKGPLAHPVEPTYPCCLPALGGFGRMPPREGSAFSVRGRRRLLRMADDAGERDGVARREDVSGALERISDADRERAAELVRNALGDGRLGLDELDDRLGAVMAARTRGDLAAALVHLPDAGTVLDATRPAAEARPFGEPTVIQASSAPVRRIGPWEVPALLAVRVQASSVILDFMEAVLPGPAIHLDLDIGSTSLMLVVPDDIQVVDDGVDQHASTMTIRTPREPRAPRAVVRITGTARTSSVVARGPGWYRRRALRKAARRSP